jgi:hypothetical protein
MSWKGSVVRVPRFHLRTLMVAVGIIAALLMDLRINISWWAVKPALYLIFIPLVSATLAARSPRPRLVVLVGAINALLLLAWYDLRRPTEGILLGGEDVEYVLHIIQDCCCSLPSLGIRRAFGWVVWRGTMPDLLCLIGSMLMLMAMLARSISFRFRILGAMALTVLSIYGWATSKRWGGTVDYQDWLISRHWYGGDKTPIHLAERCLYEGDGLPRLWKAIGAVRALELVVLVMVFVFVAAIALRSVRDSRMGISPPQ